MYKSMPLLSVENLTLNINNLTILSDINFSIMSGEVVAIIGSSGSGKSMTALTIMRLLPPTAKVSKESIIQFLQKNVLNQSEVFTQSIRGKHIGMVFQEPMTALNPVLTVGEQISEILRQHLKFSKFLAKQEAIQLLQQVGLSNPVQQYHNYPHQLSGGMRQRVVIAMAIAAKPQLLIADEPTSALDIFTQTHILKLLRELQQKHGMGMLFITHDLQLAKKIADRVIVLQKGKIIQQADAQTFFAQITKNKSSISVNENDECNKQAIPLLRVKNLKVHFPIKKGLFKRTVDWVKAVDDVSFYLNKGRTLALVGESGSGKTTLGRSILRLIPPTAGQVVWMQTDLMSLSYKELQPLRRNLQIIFQDPFSSLNPRLLIGDIIAEGLVAQRLIKDHSAKELIIDQLLVQVGLPLESKHRYPHEFSGGQRQRIGIARALAVKPQLIICDEPTSALDIDTQTQVLDLLAKLQKEFNLSYLFITHNIPLAADIADDIVVMYQGKIIEQGSTYQILSAPKHPYTKALLEAVTL